MSARVVVLRAVSSMFRLPVLHRCIISACVPLALIAFQAHVLPPVTRSVTMVEAKEVLGSFDASLREYAARMLIKHGVTLRKGGRSGELTM